MHNSIFSYYSHLTTIHHMYKKSKSSFIYKPSITFSASNLTVFSFFVSRVVSSVISMFSVTLSCFSFYIIVIIHSFTVYVLFIQIKDEHRKYMLVSKQMSAVSGCGKRTCIFFSQNDSMKWPKKAAKCWIIVSAFYN